MERFFELTLKPYLLITGLATTSVSLYSFFQRSQSRSSMVILIKCLLVSSIGSVSTSIGE